MYGIYSDYESDFTGHYNLTTGVAVSVPSDEFATIEVQEGTYMVFEAKGVMPQGGHRTMDKNLAVFPRKPSYKKKIHHRF